MKHPFLKTIQSSISLIVTALFLFTSDTSGLTSCDGNYRLTGWASKKRRSTKTRFAQVSRVSIFLIIGLGFSAAANAQTRGRMWVYHQGEFPSTYLEVYDRASQTLLTSFNTGNGYVTRCNPKYGGGVAYDASDGKERLLVSPLRQPKVRQMPPFPSTRFPKMSLSRSPLAIGTAMDKQHL